MGTEAISAQIVGTDPKAQETFHLDKDGKLQVVVPAKETCTNLTLRSVGRFRKPVDIMPTVDIESGVSSFELVTESNKLFLSYVKNGKTFTLHNAELVKKLTEKVMDRASYGCFASAR